MVLTLAGASGRRLGLIETIAAVLVAGLLAAVLRILVAERAKGRQRPES